MNCYKRLNKISDSGRLIKELDTLFSQVIAKERGPGCEIHPNKDCDRVGNMHILSKQAHPRLRYCKENVIRAGWFCSHYWTHHNPDDPRAIKVKERIIKLRGERYLEDLYGIEKYTGKHDRLYLLALKQQFKANLQGEGMEYE